MNALQRYSRELVAAGTDAEAPRDTSLVWRGQVIERVAVPVDDTAQRQERALTWLDRVMTRD